MEHSRPFPRQSPAIRQRGIEPGSPDGDMDLTQLDVELRRYHIGEEIPRVSFPIRYEKDLTRGMIPLDGQHEGLDKILNVTEAQKHRLPTHHGDETLGDAFEDLKHIGVPGPVDGTRAQDGDVELVPATEDRLLTMQLALAIWGDGAHGVILRLSPLGRRGAGSGLTGEVDKSLKPLNVPGGIYQPLC